jgi:DNA repair protein RadC
MKNPETLALCMDYAAAMEACAAYVAVSPPAIREPQAAANFVRPLITAATNGNAQESFFVILLDTKNKPIGIPRETTRGLLDSSPVHPREVFREAVRDSAASLILAHNHPLC